MESLKITEVTSYPDADDAVEHGADIAVLQTSSEWWEKKGIHYYCQIICRTKEIAHLLAELFELQVIKSTKGGHICLHYPADRTWLFQLLASRTILERIS